MSGQFQSLADLIKPIEHPKEPTTRAGKAWRWLQQQWAMMMLRRDFAARGVHVWKYTDDELKEQMREGLRQCVKMLEDDARRRNLRLCLPAPSPEK